MCYHVGISPLGGLVDSFSQLYFTINLEEIFYFNNKKSRIYAAFGVSQAPKGEYCGKGAEFTYDVSEYLASTDVYDTQSYSEELNEEENEKLNTIFSGTKEISITVGKFKGGFPNGKVKQYEYGKLLYDGQEKKGEYDGKGKLYYSLSDNLRYKGKFTKGKYNGKGTEYDEDGNKLYSGKWSMGDYKN
ncbi:hypothetical protein [Roseburia sp. 831b]|uniref:hypothetical protein n=1 Tax=Roseburia sp. 831b TaxID=1261635 RepID=UPI002ED072ED|nr:hypothetical protein BIV16_15145 [Roseburia sp. 831b]